MADDGQMYEEMEDQPDLEEEPRLIVMPSVQKPSKQADEESQKRQSRVEKKMRKQIRDRIVNKDHTNDPNDRRTFLKEI